MADQDTQPQSMEVDKIEAPPFNPLKVPSTVMEGQVANDTSPPTIETWQAFKAKILQHTDKDDVDGMTKELISFRERLSSELNILPLAITGNNISNALHKGKEGSIEFSWWKIISLPPPLQGWFWDF
jgi:hypothetical protein